MGADAVEALATPPTVLMLSSVAAFALAGVAALNPDGVAYLVLGDFRAVQTVVNELPLLPYTVGGVIEDPAGPKVHSVLGPNGVGDGFPVALAGVAGGNDGIALDSEGEVGVGSAMSWAGDSGVGIGRPAPLELAAGGRSACR